MIISILNTFCWVGISCMIVMYYLNMTLEYKHSRFRSNLICAIGFGVSVICSFLRLYSLNMAVSIIMLILIIYLGFKESVLSSVIKGVFINLFMIFSEWTALVFIFKEISESVYSFPIEILAIAVSKMLYFLLMILFKRISTKQKNTKMTEIIFLLILPIATCLFFSVLNRIFNSTQSDIRIILYIFSILLILSNFVVYILFDRNIDNNIKIQQFQEMKFKNDLDYNSYELLKEKYAELKIMVHDFNKYCNNIEGLLKDDSEDISSYIHSIQNKNKEFMLIEYTNNKALNILLSQKMKECNKQNIDFQLFINKIDLSFISEIDTIAIFANLIDNAIESCINSRDKKIFLSINLMNNAFIVINLDNSSDKKPISIGKHIQSTKSGKDKHGIGLLSINQSIKNYNGSMEWSYDHEKHVFSSIIIIDYLKDEPLSEPNMQI